MAITSTCRLRADGHRFEQVVAAEHLAALAGEFIEGGHRVVDDAGHRAEDEPFATVAVGADQIDNASQISGALAPEISTAVLPASVSSPYRLLPILTSLMVALSRYCRRSCFPRTRNIHKLRRRSRCVVRPDALRELATGR